MKDRNDRLMTIRQLISSRKIASQEELLTLLEGKGFSMTQATLSRDLKYLKVAKIPDEERGYVYMLTEREPDNPSGMDKQNFSGFVSIDFAQGMGIMKTLPGHAGMVAYMIDKMNAWEIAGTIAGDDTILIIPRDGVKRNDMVNLLTSWIPEIKKDQRLIHH